MKRRSQAHGKVSLSGRTAVVIGVLLSGALLILLGLPSDWIDLAALALAVTPLVPGPNHPNARTGPSTPTRPEVPTRPDVPSRPTPAVRQLRPKHRIAKRRPPRTSM